MNLIKNNAALLATLALVSGCSSIGKNNSNWMSQNKSQLDNKTLGQIIIPGTHYSNAYGINNTLPICKGETNPKSMSRNAKVAKVEKQSKDLNHDDFIEYLNTQDTDIYHQLNSGIRYLEMQICMQNDSFYTSNYYIGASLTDIIQQINKFIAENPNEILIIDLDNNTRDENGFINETHSLELDTIIKKSFNKLLITKSKHSDIKTLKINKILHSSSRIIVMSSNPNLFKYDEIWDKNNLVRISASPTWTTIKKLTNIQLTVNQIESSNESGLTIIPIYSSFNPEKNTTQEIGNNFNNHLIMDYLYTFPESTPINIVVGELRFNKDIVKFSQKSFNATNN